MTSSRLMSRPTRFPLPQTLPGGPAVGNSTTGNVSEGGVRRLVLPKRRYTVAQIAAEFGVTRPTIYRHLEPAAPHARAPS